jgi:hypothetical protein
MTYVSQVIINPAKALATGAIVPYRAQRMLSPVKAPSYDDLSTILINNANKHITSAEQRLRSLKPIPGHDGFHFWGINSKQRYHNTSQKGEIFPTYTENQLKQYYERLSHTGQRRFSSLQEMEKTGFRDQLAAVNARDLNKELAKTTYRPYTLTTSDKNSALLLSSPYEANGLVLERRKASINTPINTSAPSLLEIPGKGFVIQRNEKPIDLDKQPHNGIVIKPQPISYEQLRQVHNRWIRHAWREQAINGPLPDPVIDKIPSITTRTTDEVLNLQESVIAYARRPNTVGLPSIDHGPRYQISSKSS